MANEWRKEIPAVGHGEQDALGPLLEQHRRFLLLIAEQELEYWLRAKGGASDLVQVTFLEAQQSIQQYSGTSEEEMRSWLRQILIHNIQNFRRHWLGTAKRQVQREIPLSVEPSPETAADLIDAAQLTPSRELVSQEEEETLLRQLERLPEDYQQVLMMRYRENLSFEEIAQRMQRTSEATRKLWSRAIQRLREVMTEQT